MPSSLTTIGESAFEGCLNLSSITIPNSVKTIETGAFYSCNALTSITIPKSVTKIGGVVFFDCHNVSSMKVEVGNPVYDSRNICNAIIETKTNALIVEQEREVDAVRIRFLKDSSAYEYKIETSRDGKSWQLQTERTCTGWDFKPLPVGRRIRYIRLTVVSVSEGQPGVAEISLY